MTGALMPKRFIFIAIFYLAKDFCWVLVYGVMVLFKTLHLDLQRSLDDGRATPNSQNALQTEAV